MSRRKPGQQPVRAIPHPNDPSIIFYAKKPRRADFESVNEILNKHRTIRPVKDGDVVMKDADGSVMKFADQYWPREANIESLRIHCHKIEGILDESGNPMPLDAALNEMFESWLDCEVDEADVTATAASGAEQKRTKKVPMAYGRYVDRQVSKPEFFDPDPPVPSSETS